MRGNHLVLVHTVGLAVLAAACGDDDGTGTSTSSSSSTTTGATTGSGMTTSSSSSSSSSSTGGGEQDTFSAIVIDGPTMMPLEGAGVAIDLEDGTRVEGLSDANGEVTLSFPATTTWASAIAHQDGRNFVVFPGGMFQEPIQFFLDPDGSDTTGMVTVSGTATNMNSNADLLAVIAQLASGRQVAFEQESVSMYELLIPADDDFTLTFINGSPFAPSGQDFTRTLQSYVTSQQTGINVDTTIDVDFATGIAPSGSFTTSLAKAADASLAANGFAIVNAASDNGFAGGSTSCVHDAVNDEYDCTGDLYDNGATVSSTFYVIMDKASPQEPGRLVQAMVPGGPPSGLVDPDFPNPPTVTAPSGAGPHPVDTPMQYTIEAGGGAADFTLYNLSAVGGRFLGFAFLPEGSFTIPALPSTSNAAAHFEATMRAAIFRCRVVSGQCGAVGVQEWDASPPN